MAHQPNPNRLSANDGELPAEIRDQTTGQTLFRFPREGGTVHIHGRDFSWRPGEAKPSATSAQPYQAPDNNAYRSMVSAAHGHAGMRTSGTVLGTHRILGQGPGAQEIYAATRPYGIVTFTSNTAPNVGNRPAPSNTTWSAEEDSMLLHAMGNLGSNLPNRTFREISGRISFLMTPQNSSREPSSKSGNLRSQNPTMAPLANSAMPSIRPEENRADYLDAMIMANYPPRPVEPGYAFISTPTGIQPRPTIPFEPDRSGRGYPPAPTGPASRAQNTLQSSAPRSGVAPGINVAHQPQQHVPPHQMAHNRSSEPRPSMANSMQNAGQPSHAPRPAPRGRPVAGQSRRGTRNIPAPLQVQPDGPASSNQMVSGSDPRRRPSHPAARSAAQPTSRNPSTQSGPRAGNSVIVTPPIAAAASSSDARNPSSQLASYQSSVRTLTIGGVEVIDLGSSLDSSPHNSPRNSPAREMSRSSASNPQPVVLATSAQLISPNSFGQSGPRVATSIAFDEPSDQTSTDQAVTPTASELVVVTPAASTASDQVAGQSVTSTASGQAATQAAQAGPQQVQTQTALPTAQPQASTFGPSEQPTRRHIEFKSTEYYALMAKHTKKTNQSEYPRSWFS
ncbi:hypothetical protein BU23DRAFT_662869 [Bimuria novae-zelandiae CBS 107.79]|uniref:Uncharacterized protein n=1 Tax=Bimuria novae-zelandiae CBS 107.79 TaxID=1447943 RepID=A0A6A5VLB1_9PLEO|nr:hypothetical protein BU23DRAFT_662869 [Bimuria novae-zelandiae CBS 107.79]